MNSAPEDITTDAPSTTTHELSTSAGTDDDAKKDAARLAERRRSRLKGRR
jgi:hypothetical protein